MKKVLYIVYLLVITLIILEVAVRLFTTSNKAHVDLLLNKKHRYLLPLPTSPEKYVEEALAADDTDMYRTYDDTLGWGHNSWGYSTEDFPCFANDKGIRISKAMWEEKIPAKPHYNIITIGDSFTHGDAVAAEESWPYLLENISGRRVANLGVGGYGIQQALLRLMTSQITADTILFGVIWGDFERAIEPVYSFYTGGNKTKPIIAFSADQTVELVNVPVKKPFDFYQAKSDHALPIFSFIPGYDETVFSDAVWTKSYTARAVVSFFHQKRYYREKPIYLTEADDLNYCLKIFETFHKYCEKEGMYGEIVLLDTSQNFYHKSKWKLDNPWELVSQNLKQKGIPHIEFHKPLFDAYSQNRSNLIHPVENLHYSPEGNKLVADLLAKHLNLN